MRVKVGFLWLLLVIAFSLVVSPVVGKMQMPNFTLTDIYGTTFSLSDYQGKVVLIEFFYIGCSGCEAEIPEFKQLCDEYSSDQFAIVSIDVIQSDTDNNLKTYIQQHEIPYGAQWRVARDTVQLGEKYVKVYVPTLLIIGKEGFIEYHEAAVLKKSELVSIIDPLLSETGNGDSNGDSPGDSDTEQNGSPYTLIAIIVVAAIVLLVVGIVVTGQQLGWSEPAKKRRSRKGKR